MSRFNQNIFLLLGFIWLSGCEKPPEYPLTPSIEFVSLNSHIFVDPVTNARVDSITVSLKFTDGDGDLGITTEMAEEDTKYRSDTLIVNADTIVIGGDTTFIQADTAYEHQNFYIDTYKKIDGEYVLQNFNIELGGRFDPMTEVDKVGPIDGTLNYGFKVFEDLFGSGPLSPGDTLQFDIYIIDRALRQSNVVRSTDHVLFVN